MKGNAIKKIFICMLVIYTSGVVTGFAQDLWLMKGHDRRRTGQSQNNGPRVIDLTKSWSVEAPAAFVLNIGATVTQHGVYFASWGLQRKDSLGRDGRFWDKADGKLYGHRLDDGHALWNKPVDLDLTPRCYEYAGRPKSSQDNLFCPNTPYHVSYYNGTVEGQAVVDTARNVLYLGRGDGKLYAIHPETGRILWRFSTYNPQLPSDPDGGGEIVAAPVIGDDGAIYFGTWGVGPYETNAFYAVNPNGTLQWRFPADSSLTKRPIFTSPAISADGATIYFGTFFQENAQIPAKLYALNLRPSGAVPDNVRRKWEMELQNAGTPVWTMTLAIGSDGAIYAGGYTQRALSIIPMVFAVREVQGAQPVFKWNAPYVELRDGAHFVGGIALREINGQTQRLYVTTANLRDANDKEEGKLYAIAPASGQVLAEYDPSTDVSPAAGSLNSPAIGADGVIYFGVRGKYKELFVEPVNGHVFAVDYDTAATRFNKLWHYPVEGHIEWNHPAIGPDGGIYVGSSIGGKFNPFEAYDHGVIPPNTTPKFYALKPLTTSVSQHPIAPNNFFLEQNYPNPFNPSTTLRFNLPATAQVTLKIFNVFGQEVRTLLDRRVDAGSHQVVWDGRDDAGKPFASGVYFLRMAATGNASAVFVQVRKMMLVQ